MLGIKDIAKKLITKSTALLQIHGRVDPVIFSFNNLEQDIIPLTLKDDRDIHKIQDTINILSEKKECDAILVLTESCGTQTVSTDDIINDPHMKEMLMLTCFTRDDTQIYIIFFTKSENKFNFFDVGWVSSEDIVIQYKNPWLD